MPRPDDYQKKYRSRMATEQKDRKKRQLLRLHGPVCNMCKQTLDEQDLTIDHIFPVRFTDSYLGDSINELDNLQLLCEPCNRDKGGFIIPELISKEQWDVIQKERLEILGLWIAHVKDNLDMGRNNRDFVIELQQEFQYRIRSTQGSCKSQVYVEMSKMLGSAHDVDDFYAWLQMEYK